MEVYKDKWSIETQCKIILHNWLYCFMNDCAHSFLSCFMNDCAHSFLSCHKFPLREGLMGERVLVTCRLSLCSWKTCSLQRFLPWTVVIQPDCTQPNFQLQDMGTLKQCYFIDQDFHGLWGFGTLSCSSTPSSVILSILTAWKMLTSKNTEVQ